MARTSLQYKKQLQSLLPKGKLWPKDDDAELTKLLYGLSEELSRIEERAENLINEKLIATTSELLTEQEEDFGLPEYGEELEPTIDGRRLELSMKQAMIGQQDANYFVDICAAFGYTVKITEFTPFWAGLGCAGDPCGDQYNLFYWKVEIYVESVTESIEVNLDKLFSKINGVRPGHTHLLMDWYKAPFDRSFDRSFLRFYHYDNYWIEKDFSRDFDNSFANAYDYYGTNYTGSFNYAFSLDFDRHSGGSFFTDDFSLEFSRPS